MMRWVSPQTLHCLELLLYLLFGVKFTCPARSKFVGAHPAIDPKKFADPWITVCLHPQSAVSSISYSTVTMNFKLLIQKSEAFVSVLKCISGQSW